VQDQHHIIVMLTLQLPMNELLADVSRDEVLDIETSWNNWKSALLQIMSLCVPSMKLNSHKRLQ